tara:strand:- start:129 stop:473 length:345 start_codon:yes stop_codon:yes gene_type:complete
MHDYTKEFTIDENHSLILTYKDGEMLYRAKLEQYLNDEVNLLDAKSCSLALENLEKSCAKKGSYKSWWFTQHEDFKIITPNGLEEYDIKMTFSGKSLGELSCWMGDLITQMNAS